jgi:dTDP-4-dehydrorhamnose reductase
MASSGPSDPSAPPAAPRVLIFGSRGYLGGAFVSLYPHAATPLVDVADPQQVRKALAEHRPEVVINCAGRGGTPNVDWCESHQLETIHANVLGPLVLLEECSRVGARLVQLGSGCLYTGDNGGAGFAEDDPPNFTGSFYSRSKLWSEQVLREFPVLLLRPRMPFDDSHSERNLLMKLRRYRRVLTELNSLTWVPDLLAAARVLIERGRTGVFNVVNPGAVSPYEVMQMYRSLVDPGHTFEPLSVAQLAEVARAGRSNCLLDTSRLREEGIQLCDVREALRRALGSLAHQLVGGFRP